MRAGDYRDVLGLVKARRLDEAFAARLDPYVRPKFLEIVAEFRKAEARGEE